jgi:hypothetical protein
MQVVARVLPMSHAVSLLRGIWKGEGWLAHGADVAALMALFVVATFISSRVFRWE